MIVRDVGYGIGMLVYGVFGIGFLLIYFSINAEIGFTQLSLVVIAFVPTSTGLYHILFPAVKISKSSVVIIRNPFSKERYQRQEVSVLRNGYTVTFKRGHDELMKLECTYQALDKIDRFMPVQSIQQ